MQVIDKDALADPRAAVARAIASLRSFNGNAGTTEMRSVIRALDLLGCAYSYLDNPSSNPAWSDLD